MRLLIHIPTMHTLDEVPAEVEESLTDAGKERARQASDRVWDHIEERIALLANLQGVRIYPEGLMTNNLIVELSQRDPEAAIRILRESNSRQKNLVGDLLSKGGILEPTENALINRVRTRVILHITKKGGSLRDSRAQYLAQSACDMQIARRISHTLPDQSSGILIMGDAHNVNRFLRRDIQVHPLSPALGEMHRETLDYFRFRSRGQNEGRHNSERK